MHSENDLVHGLPYEEWEALPQRMKDDLIQADSDRLCGKVSIVLTAVIGVVFLFMVVPVALGM